MKKLLTVFMVLFTIQSACFAIGPKSTMEKVLSSWVGENINTVINSWGFPDNQKTIAGRNLYYWQKTSYSASGNMFYMYGEELVCERILEVDENEKVVNYHWKGNNCPATYLTAKKYINKNNNPWKNNKVKF